MHWPRFAVLILITTLIQANWVDAIAVTSFHATPDLLLIMLVFFAINCEPTEGIISSFTIGLAADIVATGFPMGPRIISYGLFGTGLVYTHQLITIRKIPQEAIAILVTGLGAGLLAKMLAFLASRTFGTGGIGTLTGSLIYSAIVGPFLFMFLDWVMRIKKQPGYGQRIGRGKRRGQPPST